MGTPRADSTGARMAGWFGQARQKENVRAAAEPARDFEALNRAVPLAAAPAADGSRLVGIDEAGDSAPPSALCREAILGRDERIAGYEFAIRRALQTTGRGTPATARRLQDQVVLLNTLWSELPRVLGHRYAAVTIHPSSLDLPHLAKLVEQRTVACVDVESAPEDAALAQHLRALRAARLVLGLTGLRAGGAYAESLREVQFVAVNVSDQSPTDLAEIARRVRRDAPHARLVARRLVSQVELALCLRLGFDAFQGPFVTSREAWAAPANAGERQRLVRLLAEIQASDDLERTANALRTFPDLQFRLLAYLNSAAMGLTRKVGSVRDAVMLLGSQKLLRWLSVLILASKELGGRGESILEAALVRGRVMEIIGEPRMPARALDELFTLGVMSLLPAAMHRPLEALLGELRLPEPQHLALVRGAGPYGPYLALATALQGLDDVDLDGLCAGCGVTIEQAGAANMQAMEWAQAFAAAAA